MSNTNTQQHQSLRKGSWTKTECQQFVIALEQVGKQWQLMPNFIPTRTQSQIRSHAQKYFGKLESQFQSKDILGEQFEKIKGQVNLRQYKIYLKLVKPQPRKQSDIPTTDKKELINTIKTQLLLDNQDPISFVRDEMLFQTSSTTFTGLSKASQPTSFFSQMINPDLSWNQGTFMNFYSIFVDKTNSQPLQTNVHPLFNKTNYNQGFISFRERFQSQK